MAYDGTKPASTSYIADGPNEIQENFRALKEDKIVNAGQLSDLSVGHAAGDIPISDSTVCQGLNAALFNGYSVSDFAGASHTHSAVTTTSNGFMINTDKVKLDGIATGAEVNQFAFSNISVGGTTISADTKQDTLTLTAGTGITLTPDAGNDKVTVGSTCLPLAGGTMTGNITSCHIVPTTATTFSLGNGTYPYNRLYTKDVYGYNSDLERKYVILADGPMIRPDTTDTGLVGHRNYKWKAVYATTFYGDLIGNAASATSLVSQSQNNGIISAGTSCHYGGAAFRAREREFVGETQTDIDYAPRISWHWRNIAAGNLILDRYASFHFTAANSDTAYLYVNARDFFSKSRNCWFAPQPSTSAGVGQVVNYSQQSALTLPSGGTWFVHYLPFRPSEGTIYGDAVTNVVAGGSSIGADNIMRGFAVRIS